MKKIFYVFLATALWISGLSSISLAQDGLPVDDAGQKEDVRQNINDMVKLLEELQNDEEMSKELFLPNSEIDPPTKPDAFKHIVKPKENSNPASDIAETNVPENASDPVKKMVQRESNGPGSSLKHSAPSPAANADKQGDIEKNVNDMVQLLENLQNDEKLTQQLSLPQDGNDPLAGSDPLEQFVKPGEIQIPVPDPAKRTVVEKKIEPGNEVVRFYLDGPDSHFQRGLEKWRATDRFGAISEFEEVVRLAPENAHAYWNLGLLYDETNQGQEAIANIKKAQSIYSKYEYITYSVEAKKRLQTFSEKYGNP